MVVLAQFGGIFLIFIGVALLKEIGADVRERAKDLLLLGVGFLAYFLYPWWSRLVMVIKEWFSDEAGRGLSIVLLAPPKIRKRLLQATLCLVISDTILLGVLISMTGGFGASPLDPLLPVIPIIAVILRQPRRTVILTILLQILFTFLIVSHWSLHGWNSGHPHNIFNRYIYNAHEDTRFALAFCAVAFGAILLSLIEFFITHRQKSPPGLDKALERAGASLADRPLWSLAVARGMRDWLSWLDAQGLPPEDISLVHKEENAVSQAVILSLPYWNGEASGVERERITRKITFLTYGSHWIDDHFDPQGKLLLDERIFQHTDERQPLEHLRADDRLRELLSRMKKLVPNDRQYQIERAIGRIIYGGLIQNAETRGRLTDLLHNYVEYIFDRQPISDSLKQEYMTLVGTDRRISIWVTTKVVIELLDCCGSNFSPDKAEFYNLLYGPILYYQDCKEEIEKEGFGSAFGDSPEQELPRVGDMIQLITDCHALLKPVFGDGRLPAPRRKQLNCLLKTYGKQLAAEVRNAYEGFL